MKDWIKKILEPPVVRKITGTICSIQGVFTIFLAVMVWKLFASTSVDYLGVNVSELMPKVISFCLFYGVVNLVYAYLRFFFEKENKFVKVCWKYKITVILFILLSGMSLSWVIPTLTASTDLKNFIEVPIGVVGIVAILLDAYLYIRVFVKWLRG